jgi:diphthamide synthase (EF-2-diphthine--ammonia ligase)
MTAKIISSLNKKLCRSIRTNKTTKLHALGRVLRQNPTNFKLLISGKINTTFQKRRFSRLAVQSL